MKIPKKFTHLIYSFLIALIIPFLMTFFVTLINAGFSKELLFLWMRNFGIAFIIAFPLIYLIAPKIRKAVEAITE